MEIVLGTIDEYLRPPESKFDDNVGILDRKKV
jgi:hypothetical protein